ncbi:hypothetical protein ES703_100917 [subsurface metagenome]
MHQIAGVFQHRAELAARVEVGKFERGEAAAFEKRNRQGIADRRLHQRGGGRRQIVRAGFAHLRQLQHDARGRTERGFRVRGDRNHRDGKARRVIDEVLHLRLFAGPGQRQDHVIRRDHAEVAVACFRGVDKEGGGAGRGQGRRDLAADMA